MFEANLSDPVHGSTTARAETTEAAVEAAFRELALGWMYPGDVEKLAPGEPLFDGEIRNDIEVWWHNRMWGLIGTVRPV